MEKEKTISQNKMSILHVGTPRKFVRNESFFPGVCIKALGPDGHLQGENILHQS